MYYLDHYVVDWDRVKTVDDLRRLLAAMQIAFEPDDPRVGWIKDLVKRRAKCDPIEGIWKEEA